MDISAGNQFCPRCNTPLTSTGREFIRTEIEFIPAKVRMIDYYKESHECRECKKTDMPYIEKAPRLYPVVMHSVASSSSAVHVRYQKFLNAIPLYYQENDWNNCGVKLSMATMVNWIMVSLRDCLTSLVELLYKKLIKEKYIYAHKTRVQVLNEPD